MLNTTPETWLKTAIIIVSFVCLLFIGLLIYGYAKKATKPWKKLDYESLIITSTVYIFIFGVILVILLMFLWCC